MRSNLIYKMLRCCHQCNHNNWRIDTNDGQLPMLLIQIILYQSTKLCKQHFLSSHDPVVFWRAPFSAAAHGHLKTITRTSYRCFPSSTCFRPHTTKLSKLVPTIEPGPSEDTKNPRPVTKSSSKWCPLQGGSWCVSCIFLVSFHLPSPCHSWLWQSICIHPRFKKKGANAPISSSFDVQGVLSFSQLYPHVGRQIR